MKPAPFQLHRPRSVIEAVELLTRLQAGDDEARVVAGGQSLVPMMNFRLARPDHLIDLEPVAELTAIGVEEAEPGGDDELVIGAMVRQADALVSPLVARHAPMLAAAIAHIGHGHIRNRGTVGGSVAHADPAAELPVALLALDATIEIAGPGGARRSVPAAEFFLGWFTTALAPDELLTAVRVPSWLSTKDAGSERAWGFEELARRQGDYAMALVATVVERGAGDLVTGARVVLGGVAPTPVRAAEAEAELAGTALVDRAQAAARAATAAAQGIDPPTDVHADAAYRRELVAVLVERALTGPETAPVDPTGMATGFGVTAAGPTDADRSTPVVVNGVAHTVAETEDRRLLADWLRDDIGLTGTHLGCEHGVCGACTVLVDQRPVRSCLSFAVQAAGHEVTTIEGVGSPDHLHPVQAAFRDHHGLQCGFCTPGMVLSAIDLLARRPAPSEAEIRNGLSGNLCRCTGYTKIIEAVRAAADSARVEAGGSPTPGGG